MRIGAVLRRWRLYREVSLRSLAKEIGLTPSTLSRLETGENIDAASMWKVWQWLMSQEKA